LSLGDVLPGNFLQCLKPVLLGRPTLAATLQIKLIGSAPYHFFRDVPVMTSGRVGCRLRLDLSDSLPRTRRLNCGMTIAAGRRGFAAAFFGASSSGFALTSGVV